MMITLKKKYYGIGYKDNQAWPGSSWNPFVGAAYTFSEFSYRLCY